jgi:hypothetical protein
MFYPGDWSKDPDLRRCSKAAKGVWMDMLCMMFECPIRGVLADSGGSPWSDQEIAEAAGGPIGTNLECIAELVAKGVAHRNDRGAIFSRRLVRDEETRRQTQKRVQKHRSNGLVTPDVTLVKRLCTVNETENVNEEPPKDGIIDEIALLHPKLSHLREGRIPQQIRASIIDAVGEEAGRLKDSPAIAAQFVLKATRARIEKAKTDGRLEFLENPLKFFGWRLYREESGPQLTKARSKSAFD